MPDCVYKLLLCTLMATAWSLPAWAEVPGELPVRLGRACGGPAVLPALDRLHALANNPETTAVAVLALAEDPTRYFVPQIQDRDEALAMLVYNQPTRTMKIKILSPLSSAEGKILNISRASYDTDLAWVPGANAFVVGTTESPLTMEKYLNLVYGQPGGTVTPVTRSEEVKRRPSVRLDAQGQVHCVYEQEGQLLHIAFSANRPAVAPPRTLLSGAYPWLAEDATLYCARARGQSRGLHLYDIVRYSLPTGAETLLYRHQGKPVRHVVPSPDRKWLAFYEGDAEGNTWALQVVPLSGSDTPATIDSNVVIEEQDLIGPSWDPAGRRLYFFSGNARKENYRPLLFHDIASRRTGQVHYSETLFLADSVKAGARSNHPFVVFNAHHGNFRGTYALILNHY